MARPTILLVDDNRLFIEMEKEFLQPCAVMIHTARTGQEALDLVRMVRPDLIFMDLHMPEMNGAECCAILKADPDLCSIPIVMIVTADSDDDLLRCSRAGCDHMLTKPVDRDSFIRTGRLFIPGIEKVELRTPCLTLVVFRIGDRVCYGTSANLSSQGIFIAFDDTVQIDDLINITFLVPGSDACVVEAVGRIAWVNAGPVLRKTSLPRGFGVEFITIKPDGLNAIADYMARLVAQGAAPVVEEAYVASSLFEIC